MHVRRERLHAIFIAMLPCSLLVLASFFPVYALQILATRKKETARNIFTSALEQLARSREFFSSAHITNDRNTHGKELHAIFIALLPSSFLAAREFFQCTHNEWSQTSNYVVISNLLASQLHSFREKCLEAIRLKSKLLPIYVRTSNEHIITQELNLFRQS